MGSRLPLRSCVTAAIVFQLVDVVDGIWHRLVFFFRAYPIGILFIESSGITMWYYLVLQVVLPQFSGCEAGCILHALGKTCGRFEVFWCTCVSN